MKELNPWNLPEFTKLRHKRWGWTVVYEYDLCYQEWLLWNGQSYMPLSEFTLDEFEIEEG